MIDQCIKLNFEMVREGCKAHQCTLVKLFQQGGQRRQFLQMDCHKQHCWSWGHAACSQSTVNPKFDGHLNVNTLLSQCPMFIAKIPKTLTDIPHLLRALWFGRFGPGCQRRSSFNQRTLHRACLMVWYFVWYYHNIKYDIVWYGGSATPGYSLSWMTRSEQSCGLPTTNLVKLTHLPSRPSSLLP